MYLISDKVRNGIMRHLDEIIKSSPGCLSAEKIRQAILLSKYLKKLKKHNHGTGMDKGLQKE